MKNQTRALLLTLGLALLTLCGISGWLIHTAASRTERSDREEVRTGQQTNEDPATRETLSEEEALPEETDGLEETWLEEPARQFSYGHNRITTFEKSEEENGEISYIPIVGFHGRQPGEVESFSNACCDLVEELQEKVGFERIGYFPEEDRRYFDILPYLEPYDRIRLYNAVYRQVEQDSLEVWRQQEERAESSAGTFSGAESGEPGEETADKSMEEMPEIWRDYEADCFYQKKDGSQLRMVGVDRAAGSSYYVLLEAVDGVNTSVVNTDPYLGSGGYAQWIDFLEDEKTGFSCLAFSGGSRGLFYRTEDGGRSFQAVTYPSAEIELPDGSLYQPFIMPEKVWEEEGRLFMQAGQGPDGDHYEDGVKVCGLYESKDRGKNWQYVGTVEADGSF